MIETIENALIRLKALESWPFIDTGCGCKILEDRFYGFGDSGSMWTKFEGHLTADDAIAEIKGDCESNMKIGTKPEQLGECAVTVLKGREFVDRLYAIYDYKLDVFVDMYVDCWSK